MLKHVKSNKIDQNRSNQPQKWRDPSSNWFLLGAYFIWSLQGMCREVPSQRQTSWENRTLGDRSVLTMRRPWNAHRILMYVLIWLVIWNMLEHDFLWLSIIYWECHHPNWRTPSFFRGVGQPPTRYLYYISHILTIILTNSCLFLDFNVQQLHHQDDESKIWWIPVWIPRKRKPGGRLLRIFGNLLPGVWCVLMCIVVYCLFGNGDFVTICDLACDVIPIWEILWNGLKCLNVWICLDDWHIWDRV